MPTTLYPPRPLAPPTYPAQIWRLDEEELADIPKGDETCDTCGAATTHHIAHPGDFRRRVKPACDACADGFAKKHGLLFPVAHATSHDYWISRMACEAVDLPLVAERLGWLLRVWPENEREHDPQYTQVERLASELEHVAKRLANRARCEKDAVRF